MHPLDLRRGPFMVADARRTGMTWKELQNKAWTRLSRGQYVRALQPQDALLKLNAVCQRMAMRFAFSGPTAFWLNGVEVAPCDPIEVTIPRDLPARSRAGLRVRRALLFDSEIVMRRGFPVTSILRTVRDLGSRPNLTESVIAIDMALRARVIDMATLVNFVDASAGLWGISRLRRALSFADCGAESPMETRLRMELLRARLPRPRSQAELTDHRGRFLARVDLYYADCGLVIEYDGENHRDRMADDLRRQNALVNAGYHVLRFTAGDVFAPGAVATQVRRARILLTNNRR